MPLWPIVGWTATAALGIIVLAPVIPNYKGARRSACFDNLQQIDKAKRAWAFEFSKVTNGVMTMKDIQPYLGRGVPPECPEGGIYTLGRVNEPPQCPIRAAAHTLD